MPGFTQYCFADVDNFESEYVFSRIEFLKECFPHIDFFKLEDNKPSLSWVTKMMLSKRFESPYESTLRSFYKGSFQFGYDYMFFDYRIPLNEEKISYLREMILE